MEEGKEAKRHNVMFELCAKKDGPHRLTLIQKLDMDSEFIN